MPSKLDKHQVLYRFSSGCQGVGVKVERDLGEELEWPCRQVAKLQPGEI